MTRTYCDFCDGRIMARTNIQGMALTGLRDATINIQVSSNRSGKKAKDVCIRCFIAQLEKVLAEHDPCVSVPSPPEPVFPSDPFDTDAFVDVRDEEER